MNSDTWYRRNRLGGLRRFACAITILNILGHTWLGFEQSWAQPLAGIVTAYSMEVLLALIDAIVSRKRPRFATRSLAEFVDFFLPAHITGLACAMLLYANDRLLPIAFAAAVAIGTKHSLRLVQGNGTRHFLNPSNFGITVTLMLFPWVGIAPPYHFTEGLVSWGNWLLPLVIICSGTFLNVRYTRRLLLIVSWLLGFIAQAAIRHVLLDTSLTASLMPMTGVAFILFTFYMATDPPTTPSTSVGQVFFGASLAAMYGVLMSAHIVFGLFFALSIVSVLRGTAIAAAFYLAKYGIQIDTAEATPSPRTPASLHVPA